MQTLVIIGNGMASGRLQQRLHQYAKNQFKVMVLGTEAQPSYNRILLSSLLSGEKKSQDLPLLEQDWEEQSQIKTYVNETVISINKNKKTIHTANKEINYDKLVIATGSTPFIPDLPGSDLPGVIGFRTQTDVATMQQTAKNKQNAVVIGGGLLGLEAAYGLKHIGMNVTVLHRNKHLMNRQLDPYASELLYQTLSDLDINIELECNVKKIYGKESVESIELDCGKQFDTDLVVFAAGIQPNYELAKQAGLDCNKGIIINSKLETSDKDIYAIGECCEYNNQTFGLVAPVYEQADVLAKILGNTDKNAQFCIQDYPTQLKVSGVEVFSAGDFSEQEKNDEIILNDHANKIYRRLIIKNDILTGAVLFGSKHDSNWYADLIQNKIPVDDFRHSLMFGKAA